jgi:twitching motility protein PilT
MEALFRLMIERKASDIHISVGSPPILRIDGEIRPLSERPV